MASKSEAWESFWELLAEMDEQNELRAHARAELGHSAREDVEAALARCDRAMRELRAAHRALPEAVLFRGGESDLDALRRGIDRASGGLRQLKDSWRRRSNGG